MASNFQVPCVLVLLTFSLPIVGQETDARIQPIYGESIETPKVAMDEQGMFQLGERLPQAWTSLRRIVFPQRKTTPSDASWLVQLVAGGKLWSTTAPKFDGENVQFTTRYGVVEFPIEQLVGWYRRETLQDSVNSSPPPAKLDEDQLAVELEGQSQYLAGLLEAVEDDHFVFTFEGETREIPLARVQGIFMATAGLIQPDEGFLVTLTDDSQVFGEPIQWTNEQLTLDLAGLKQIRLPADEITRVEIRSPHLTFLSDVEPESAEVKGLLLPARSWKRDLTVDGHPLTHAPSDNSSRIQTYSKGLGVPSESRITYLRSDFDRLISHVCLDPAKRGAGDCVVEVLLDGKTVFQKRLTGTSPSTEIDVPLGSSERVSLAVRFGEKLELADHVNWCDARLIRVNQP
ncbi:MAG: NPCBM/NEW2 domain-containing protein [Planctomycetota bacterium]|jgi:hypothetical protein|nr:NPCBM/NEW2 domain-containing protein [Planctomycetota bacterium]MEC8302088.1 NPCBM/NEW2 domain-containing protein [Planctomycetota bacterium]MEC8345474.1 NPCBM/NEW2 domain-containing protein [Planctomycetota bacterium]